MMNKDILRCFWLPSECYHTTSSGVDAQTIRHRGTNLPCTAGLDVIINQKIDRIIAEAKEKKKDRKGNGRYLKRSPILPDGYFEIVNDALKEIYRGGGGIVFNEKQAVTVCSFLECPVLEFREWYIYVTEKR